MVDRTKESGAIRGWLLVYVVVLAFITVHGMALTAASIIIYIKPSAAGVTSFAPLSALLLYDITNALLIIYAIVLFILMFRRRKAAIVHNIIFNAVSSCFLSVGTSPDRNLTSAHSLMRCPAWLASGISWCQRESELRSLI